MKKEKEPLFRIRVKNAQGEFEMLTFFDESEECACQNSADMSLHTSPSASAAAVPQSPKTAPGNSQPNAFSEQNGQEDAEWVFPDFNELFKITPEQAQEFMKKQKAKPQKKRATSHPKKQVPGYMLFFIWGILLFAVGFGMFLIATILPHEFFSFPLPSKDGKFLIGALIFMVAVLLLLTVWTMRRRRRASIRERENTAVLEAERKSSFKEMHLPGKDSPKRRALQEQFHRAHTLPPEQKGEAFKNIFTTLFTWNMCPGFFMTTSHTQLWGRISTFFSEPTTSTQGLRDETDFINFDQISASLPGPMAYTVAVRWDEHKLHPETVTSFYDYIVNQPDFLPFPTPTRGILIAINGFTESAKNAVVEKGEYKIFLFDGTHITNAIGGICEFNELLYCSVKYAAKRQIFYCPQTCNKYTASH